jgi:hypothetical protein
MWPLLALRRKERVIVGEKPIAAEKVPGILNPEPLAAVADQLIERHAGVSQAQALS